jgi:hypothetical protein
MSAKTRQTEPKGAVTDLPKSRMESACLQPAEKLRSPHSASLKTARHESDAKHLRSDRCRLGPSSRMYFLQGHFGPKSKSNGELRYCLVRKLRVCRAKGNLHWRHSRYDDLYEPPAGSARAMRCNHGYLHVLKLIRIIDLKATKAIPGRWHPSQFIA